MTTYKTYQGIYCHVMWADDKDPHNFYISFGEYDWENEPECDSYGMRDDDVFYYYDQDEAYALLKAISNGDHTFPYETGVEDWYIDLTLDYELVEA